jgi:hypothetical protein
VQFLRGPLFSIELCSAHTHARGNSRRPPAVLPAHSPAAAPSRSCRPPRRPAMPWPGHRGPANASRSAHCFSSVACRGWTHRVVEEERIASRGAAHEPVHRRRLDTPCQLKRSAVSISRPGLTMFWRVGIDRGSRDWSVSTTMSSALYPRPARHTRGGGVSPAARAKRRRSCGRVQREGQERERTHDELLHILDVVPAATQLGARAGVVDADEQRLALAVHRRVLEALVCACQARGARSAPRKEAG